MRPIDLTEPVSGGDLLERLAGVAASLKESSRFANEQITLLQSQRRAFALNPSGSWTQAEAALWRKRTVTARRLVVLTAGLTLISLIADSSALSQIVLLGALFGSVVLAWVANENVQQASRVLRNFQETRTVDQGEASQDSSS